MKCPNCERADTLRQTWSGPAGYGVRCIMCGATWEPRLRRTANATAFAACRRALTMAERVAEGMPCRRDARIAFGDGTMLPVRPHATTCAKHGMLAAIKGARTAMRRAEKGESQ